MRIMSFICAVALLTACARSPSSSSHTFRVFTEDGVTIAQTSGGPKYEGELFTYTHVATIQQDPSRPESLLHRPDPHIAMDAEGLIYIADTGNHRIAVFDASGRYLRSFGHQGAGPGEFRRMRILTLTGDRLVVWDDALQRTTVFTTTGELVTIYSHSLSPHDRISELHCLNEETLIGLNPLHGDGSTRALAGIRGTILTPGGDTLAVIETPLVESSQQIYSRETGLRVGMSINFAGRACLLPVPARGIYITTGIEPEVLVHDIDGSLRQIIRLDQPTEPVTSRDKRYIRKLIRRRRDETESEAGRARDTAWLKNLRLPTHKAFWSDIRTDDCGYLWLLYPTRALTLEDTGLVFRVISPAGEYLGDTKWPIPDGSLGRGHLLTIRGNEETGETIREVYRIDSNQQGFVYP